MQAKTLLILAAAAILIPASASAGIVLTLSDSSQITGPGSSVTFLATAFNPGGAVYLNSYGASVDGGLVIDPTAFWNNWFFIDANSSLDVGPVELFSVLVPVDAPLGIYHGTFTILGGAGLSDGENLGSAEFDITVTPEPQPALLLGIPAGLALLLRKRRRP
jgi:hypothetical protein